MSRVVTEDAVRRGLERIGLEAGVRWLQGHRDDTVRPLLSASWVQFISPTLTTSVTGQKPMNPLLPGPPIP